MADKKIEGTEVVRLREVARRPELSDAVGTQVTKVPGFDREDMSAILNWWQTKGGVVGIFLAGLVLGGLVALTIFFSEPSVVKVEALQTRSGVSIIRVPESEGAIQTSVLTVTTSPNLQEFGSAEAVIIVCPGSEEYVEVDGGEEDEVSQPDLVPPRFDQATTATAPPPKKRRPRPRRRAEEHPALCAGKSGDELGACCNQLRRLADYTQQFLACKQAPETYRPPAGWKEKP